jgi:hypothetical protein
MDVRSLPASTAFEDPSGQKQSGDGRHAPNGFAGVGGTNAFARRLPFISIADQVVEGSDRAIPVRGSVADLEAIRERILRQ